jgi:probable phosphoglycerate mutase
MNTIYLVRHGENPANITMEFASRNIDYPLNEKGREQAQQTGEYLAGKGIQEIYASPLKRAWETAQIIAGRLGLPVTEVEQFREIEVGDLEGQPVTPELWMQHDDIFFRWLSGDADAAFPNGDNYHTLWGRMRAGLAQITQGKQNRKIVVVAHGGLFTATMPRLCPAADMRAILLQPNRNCSVSEVRLETRNGEIHGELVSWGYSDHLSGRAAEFVLGFPKRGNLYPDRGV